MAAFIEMFEKKYSLCHKKIFRDSDGRSRISRVYEMVLPVYFSVNITYRYIEKTIVHTWDIRDLPSLARKNANFFFLIVADCYSANDQNQTHKIASCNLLVASSRL